jgi:non-ribosomal peptide synthetase component F
VLSPVSFLQTLESDGVTIWECVPSYLSSVFSLNETLPALKSLDYLLVTGEAVSKSVMEKWFAVFPGKKVVNAYGPTEASDDICHFEMNKAPEQGFVPVGKPAIYVL